MEKNLSSTSPTRQATEEFFSEYKRGMQSDYGGDTALAFAALGIEHLLGADVIFPTAETKSTYNDLPTAHYTFVAIITKLQNCCQNISDLEIEGSTFNDTDDERIKVYMSSFAPSRHIVDCFYLPTCAIFLNTNLDDGSTQAVAFYTDNDAVQLSNLNSPRKVGEVYAADLLHTSQNAGELLTDAITRRLQDEYSGKDFECVRFFGV